MILTYQTHTWRQSSNFDGATAAPGSPGRLDFDALYPVVRCEGLLVPRFAVTFTADDPLDSIDLRLENPQLPAQQLPIVRWDNSMAGDPLTWFYYDCCCQGRKVPFVLSGPIPRFQLVLVTTGDSTDKIVTIETWWEPLQQARDVLGEDLRT